MPHKKYNIYGVKDKNEKKVVKKENIFDLTFRLLLVGKSQSGKGVVGTANLLLLPEFYANDFKGENIFIFSKSLDYDTKTKILIKQKKIPNENLFKGLEDEELAAVIDFCEEQYLEAEEDGEPLPQFLVILDDVMENLKQKDKNSAVNELFIRGRHINISTMVFLQYYSRLPAVSRLNSTGLIIFELPKKQIDYIADEHNYLDNRKEFHALYKAATREKHSFFVINYSNDREHRYLNKHFELIELPEE
jgi:hypothetical protein